MSDFPTFAETQILRILGPQPMTITELVHETNADPGTIRNRLLSLQRDGWVEVRDRAETQGSPCRWQTTNRGFTLSKYALELGIGDPIAKSKTT